MAQTPAPVPAYFLYGEEQRDLGLDSVHVEPIRHRSMRHDWTIRPHVHPDHVQLLWFTRGGARIGIEGEVIEAVPPCLVVHPAGMVHEIRYQPETQGHGATIATSYVARLTREDPHLGAALLEPGAWRPAPDGPARAALDHAFERLQAEVDGAGPERGAAIRAQVLAILVELAHLRAADAGDPPPGRDRDYEIVTRYRALLADRFRERKALGFYAGALGISTQRLNAACRARAGRTASEMLYDQIVTDAKRGLIYTAMTVAELAHSLGFDDPAYFNRFFAKRVGTPPGAYRARIAATRRVES
jgi:AraC family transcriptional activator of pobA